MAIDLALPCSFVMCPCIFWHQDFFEGKVRQTLKNAHFRCTLPIFLGINSSVIVKMMRKHLKISLVTLAIGTILAPLVATTYIGIISGEPFIIIFYPAVIPFAYILGGPVAFVCSLVTVWLGIKNLGESTTSPPFSVWLKLFCLAGDILGVVSFSLIALWSERSVNSILTGLLSTLPNGLITGSICGAVIAFIWHKYAQKVTNT